MLPETLPIVFFVTPEKKNLKLIFKTRRGKLNRKKKHGKKVDMDCI